MLAGAYRYTKPAALTAAKQSSTTGTNQDGSAVCANDSTDLAIVGELARIADELHVLNRNLSARRRDDMETAGLAQIIAENGSSRARR